MPTATESTITLAQNPDRWPLDVLPVVQRRDPLPALTGYLERGAGPVVELTEGGRVTYDSFEELAEAWVID